MKMPHGEITRPQPPPVKGGGFLGKMNVIVTFDREFKLHLSSLSHYRGTGNTWICFLYYPRVLFVVGKEYGFDKGGDIGHVRQLGHASKNIR